MNDYPTKAKIRSVLKSVGVELEWIVFNAEYGEKNAGILWKAHSIDDLMLVFVKECESLNIEIKSTKFTGRIHSVWFSKKSLPLQH